jgi:hypothetical protein
MRRECLEEREQRGVPQLWRDALGRGSIGLARFAAGQRERGCELRRAERELCWSEQRCEQRGHECQRVWARDGGERAQRCWPCGRERVRRERVAERQRACLSEWCRIRLGPACACECWCAAGQLECSCELQRAERELCRTEQCREQRRLERECCWAGRDGDERVECGRAARAQRVRGQRLGERQWCCVQSGWGRAYRGRCGGCVCWCAAGQRQRAAELRRAECELCWCEQCREQRVFERDCCGAGRGGGERREQQGASWRDSVCGERVAGRQWRCVPHRVWRGY